MSPVPRRPLLAALSLCLLLGALGGLLGWLAEAHRSAAAREALLAELRLAAERSSWMISSYLDQIHRVEDLLGSGIADPRREHFGLPSAILVTLRAMRGEVNAGFLGPDPAEDRLLFPDRPLDLEAVRELARRRSGGTGFGLAGYRDSYGEGRIALLRERGAPGAAAFDFVVFSERAFDEISFLAVKLPVSVSLALSEPGGRPIYESAGRDPEGAGELGKALLVEGYPLEWRLSAREGDFRKAAGRPRPWIILLSALGGSALAAALVAFLDLDYRRRRQSEEAGMVRAQAEREELMGALRECFLAEAGEAAAFAEAMLAFEFRAPGLLWAFRFRERDGSPLALRGGSREGGGAELEEALAACEEASRREGGQEHFFARGASIIEARSWSGGAFALSLPPGGGMEEEFFASSADLLERLLASKTAETRLRASLEEREILLREIHHRVKNSLQLVSSMLSLQGSSLDEGTRAELDKARRRVLTIAAVHEQLYHQESLSSIRLDRYVKDLVGLVSRDFEEARAARVELELCSGVEVPLHEALPCGIILSELLTNSLKYGLSPRGEGRVGVGLRREGEALCLEVADSGGGEARSGAPGIGMSLVTALASQIRASLEVRQDCPGRATLIRFVPSA